MNLCGLHLKFFCWFCSFSSYFWFYFFKSWNLKILLSFLFLLKHSHHSSSLHVILSNAVNYVMKLKLHMIWISNQYNSYSWQNELSKPHKSLSDYCFCISYSLLTYKILYQKKNEENVKNASKVTKIRSKN